MSLLDLVQAFNSMKRLQPTERLPPRLRSWPFVVQKAIALMSHPLIMDTDRQKKTLLGLVMVGVSRKKHSKTHVCVDIC